MEAGKAAEAEAAAVVVVMSDLAGSEEGWTGLPGMVSPHARSRSSSPGEEDECCSAADRLLPTLVTGVPTGAFFWSQEVTEGKS